VIEGPYIKYIDRDPEVLARQEAIKQKEKMAIDDEIRNQKRIEKQLKLAEETRQKEESSVDESKVRPPSQITLKSHNNNISLFCY
jgi:DNA/RNA-binding protein KIN17